MTKTKFTILGIFAILFLSLAMVSATTSTVMSIDNLNAPTSVDEDTGSFTFTFDITYTGADENANISFADSIVSSFGSLSIPEATGLNGSASETRTITGIVSNFANQGGNSLTIYINATKDSSRDDETSFVVQINEVSASVSDYCEYGEVGDLEISDFTIDNTGVGDDEEWDFLDKIEIEVEIKNTNKDDNVDDVWVEIKILDNSGNDVTGDFDFDDEEVDLGRIKDNDKEIATFTINELPADLDEGKYKIYIKAYSEDNEDKYCVSESDELSDDTYQEIEIVREEDPAVIVKEDLLKVSASCGDQNVMLNLNVYNLGSDKEEKVLVTLTNPELGIDEKVVIDNLKSGKRKEITFFFDVPEEATKSSYNLEVMTYFDYNNDEDEMDVLAYDEDSEEIDRDYSIRLDILSCKQPAPSINVDLESEMKLGENLIVKAMITNNGMDDNFVFSVENYESWAELVDISTQSATINKGESVELLITLNPTSEGTHSFNINTIVDGENYNQPVSVEVEGKPTIIPGLDNTLFYIIIAIIVVLLLILLVLIIKLASRGKSSAY